MNFDNQPILTNPVILAQLQKNRHWYLFLGIGLVALGILAILYSYTATMVSMIYLAVILLAVGGFEVFQAFKMHFWSKFFLHIILAALYILAGGFILWKPMLNAVTLTLFLAFFFIVSGLFKILFALANDLPHRGLVIFNGIITIVLGILIWSQWPVSGLWVIGLFLGVDALITGITWIMLAATVKRLKSE